MPRSIVVCNTVASAQAVFRSLPEDSPRILITSRFRPVDRAANENRLYSFERERKDAAVRGERVPGKGLICVSTQVVEAGVDVSAHRLWFEAAPWPAVIQRLGRLNRDGLDDDARAFYWAPAHSRGERPSGPYDADDLRSGVKLLRELARHSSAYSACEAIERVQGGYLKDVAQSALEPKPSPLPRASDVYALFSTDPDLHGGFTDVSPYVRGTDPDADVTVFWRSWEGSRAVSPKELTGPAHQDDEGCAVPAGALRTHLKEAKVSAFSWDERTDKWEYLPVDEIRPGMLFMLHCDSGGYDPALGWTGRTQDRLSGAPPPGPLRAEADDPRTEIGAWVPLETHLADTRREADRLVTGVGLRDLRPELARAVVEAAALHDLGKAHPKWQQQLPSITGSQGPFAKAPYQIRVVFSAGTNTASVLSFLKKRGVQARCTSTLEVAGGTEYRYALERELARSELEKVRQLPGVRAAARVPFRPGMRHEAASALTMWAEYRTGRAAFPALSVYLAACHHGKVRTYLRARTPEGDDVFGVPRELSSFNFQGARNMNFTVAADGLAGQWTLGRFVPTDYGWTALVHDLLGPLEAGEPPNLGTVPAGHPQGLGPFVLAYLEALIRIADWRASDCPSSSVKP